MKLLKDMNKEELIKEFNKANNSLKNDNLDNDKRFLLEVRLSNIERKLYRKTQNREEILQRNQHK